MNTTCQICGRPLSDPRSVAAGVGPICGDRGYRGRVSSRHQGSYGWGSIEQWESHNNPCYTCKHFRTPGKGEEIESGDSFVVTMHGLVEVFDGDSIGGYCRKLELLCDGNLTREKAECGGSGYVKRDDKKGAIDGILRTPSGDFSVQLGLEE